MLQWNDVQNVKDYHINGNSDRYINAKLTIPHLHSTQLAL